MGQHQFKHRKDILKYLSEVATNIQGDLRQYNQEVGHLRQGMEHLRKTDMAVARGDFDTAADESRESIKYLPDCVETIRAAADTQFSIEQYQQANQIYSNLIKKYPNTKDIHYQIGRCYMELRNYPDAIGEFEKEVRISGASPDIELQLGVANQMMGIEIYESAKNRGSTKIDQKKQECSFRLDKAKAHFKRSVGAADRKALESWTEEIDKLLKSL